MQRVPRLTITLQEALMLKDRKITAGASFVKQWVKQLLVMLPSHAAVLV